MSTTTALIYNPMKAFVLDNTYDEGYNILARSMHLALLPVSLITSASDTAIGIAAGATSVFMLGVFPSINRFANAHFRESIKLIRVPVLHIIGALNPRQFEIVENHGNNNPCLSLTTVNANYFWHPLSHRMKNSDHFISRHFFSRSIFVLTGLSSIITITADSIIGMLAGIFSILSLGTVVETNQMMLKNLKFGLMPGYLYISLLCFVNPWAET